MSRLIVFFFFFLSIGTPFSCAQEIRGLYVNKTDTILGNNILEKGFLDYVFYGNFNSISFYSLYKLDFRKQEVRSDFRSLIRRAKADYGITRVGAVSESLSGFINNIHLYNQDSLTLPDDRIDHYNIEFEFWSERAIRDYYCARYLDTAGYACTEDGAFSFVTNMIRELREQSSDIPGIEIEMYIGWINDDHAISLAQQLDRILYAVYREMKEDGSVNLYDFQQQRRRLEILASSGLVEMIPIFTSYDGSRDPNLNSWLMAGHTTCEAWDEYYQAFKNDNQLVNKNNMKISGYQWFKYSSMPLTPKTLKTPGPILGPRRIHRDSLVRFSFPPVAGADHYEWTVNQSGENFRRITSYPVFTKKFREPGQAMIQIRAVGCGEVSPFARLGVRVDNSIIAKDTLLIDEDVNFKIRMANKGMHLLIPKNKSGPFYIEALGIMGKKFLNKTIVDPGEYFLEFQQRTDSVQFLHISITYPNGSFSKKFSILTAGGR